MTGRERLTLVAFVAAAVALFAAMPAWRWIVAPPPAVERHPISAEAFAARVDAMVAAHTVGTTDDGVAVVRPPPGDIYLVARRWRFEPAFELDVGRTYRLHVTSADVMHGFNFPLGDADLLVMPGEDVVVSVSPTQSGRFAMQCSEYCGLEHSRMKAWVTVHKK